MFRRDSINLAAVNDLWLADRPQQALEAWNSLCGASPPALQAHLDHGNILRDLNRFEEADVAYSLAARHARDGQERASIAWNHSQLLIGLERYRQAYALAESRLQLPFHELWRPAPHFAGWPPAGEPAPLITVWSEQGLGDVLQYLRWIPLLLRRGARVRLEVEPPLLGLLREGLAWLGPALSVAVKGLAPTPAVASCQGSLLSLPWLLGQAPLNAVFSPAVWGVDAESSGYLRSPRWLPPPARQGRRPRIGLVWASGRKLEDPFLRREYERRSLPPAVLVPLLEGLAAAGADLVCLQFGVDRERAAGWRGRFAASLADSISLAQTARWIAGLDLVISVDTAIAHLVGAMGRPGWVLLPWASDPRWLRQRQDSPWYPSLTLLRQPVHADWQGLLPLLLDRFRDWSQRWARP